MLQYLHWEGMMDWIVFSASLPSKPSSSPRVTLWRRLRRLGAISPIGGMQILPLRDDCVEAFQWLAQEIRQEQGQAVIMRVAVFDGLTDQQLIAQFHADRKVEYDELHAQAATLEQQITPTIDTAAREQTLDALDKLQRRYAEIARIDYFNCPEGDLVAARLAALARALTPAPSPAAQITPAQLAAYRDALWVTRPHPHVDRLACAWFIRRFVNRDAIIRYAWDPGPDEVAFDMEDARFGHTGNLCSFETMLQAFELDDPVLRGMAEIVHEIDLRDRRYVRPEITGIDAILQGWLHADLSDREREAHGIALFEGLYLTLAARPVVGEQ
jgi:hypothetical protein